MRISGPNYSTVARWRRPIGPLERLGLALAVLLCLAPLLAACGGQARPAAPRIQVKPVPAARYPRPELLADSAWLAERLNDPNVRVVDLSPLADYRRGHIPGAVHLWWQDLTEVNNVTYGMLVDSASRKRVLSQAGIAPGKTVVAYDNAGGRYAAYFLWTLLYSGYGEGRLLNGGMGTWRAEGRPITRTVPAVTPAALADRPTDETVLYNGEDLLSRLNDRNLAIVDARTVTEARQTWGGRLRLGRIPNARPVPWDRNLGQKDTAVVREPDELRKVYADHSLRLEQEIVIYALTGVDAAQTFWTMRLLGYQQVKIYNGAWAEWGAAVPGTPYRIEPLAVGASPLPCPTCRPIVPGRVG